MAVSATDTRIWIGPCWTDRATSRIPDTQIPQAATICPRVTGSSDVVEAGNRAVNQPANKALGYGQRAVGGGTRVAQAPAKKTKHTDIAKAELMSMYPGDQLMATVMFRQWKELKSAKLRAFTGYGAWANSPTEIYLFPLPPDASLGDTDVLALVRAIIYHESIHIEQFHRDKSPPSKYKDMVRHECDAYPLTVAWIERELKTTKFKDNQALKDVKKEVDRLGKLFCKVFSDVLAHVPPAEQERRYWKFLTKGGLTGEIFLPDHPFSELKDLYDGKI